MTKKFSITKQKAKPGKELKKEKQKEIKREGRFRFPTVVCTEGKNLNLCQVDLYVTTSAM
jgi:hypothetical protein